MPRLRLLPPAVMATTPDECAPILNHLMRRGGTIAIDTETTGLDKMRDIVLFWSMATEDSRWCFPANMLPFFEPLFRRKDISWALANAKYDMHLLCTTGGYKLEGPCEDIIVMDAMADDTRSHGLKEQSWLAYEAKWGEFKELFLDPYYVGSVLGFDKAQYRQFKKLNTGDRLLEVFGTSPETVVEYASCDAYFTYMRWQDLTKELASEELPVEINNQFATLLDYFKVIEVPMTRCLWNMERRGINIDVEYARSIDEPLKDKLSSLRQKLNSLAGKKFNPNSTDQLKWILFDEENFGLKPVRYTKGEKQKAGTTPKPSTDDKALDILEQRTLGSAANQFIKLLREYKSLNKLHGTYVRKICAPGSLLLGPDGRLHTKYNQAGARTSRFSSSEPNIQNIPRPDPEKDPFLIRGMFISSDEMQLIDKDYPQIEFRVAAVNANDEKMMDAVRRGWDIHNANCANMFKIPYEEVASAKSKKKDELTARDKFVLGRRQESKTVGLGTLFGEGDAKMASQLGITKDRARELRQRFFDTYPSIAENIAYMHQFGHEFGFTFTMLGRKRRLHKINNEHARYLVAQEERQAYNTYVQGSAAELLKLAMLRIDNCEAIQQLGGRLLLTVHDELVVEAPKATAHDVAEVMSEHMSDPLHWGPLDLTYPVPITPDGEIGHRWSECH